MFIKKCPYCSTTPIVHESPHDAVRWIECPKCGRTNLPFWVYVKHGKRIN